MLEVDIEKIIPVTDARDSLNKIVDEVSAGDQLYVLTVNGKPSAVIVGVSHLEKLTGTPHDSLANDDVQSPTTSPIGEIATPASLPTSPPQSAPTQEATPAYQQPVDPAVNQSFAPTPLEPTPIENEVDATDLFDSGGSTQPAQSAPDPTFTMGYTNPTPTPYQANQPIPDSNPEITFDTVAPAPNTGVAPTQNQSGGNQFKTPQVGDLDSLNN